MLVGFLIFILTISAFLIFIGLYIYYKYAIPPTPPQTCSGDYILTSQSTCDYTNNCMFKYCSTDASSFPQCIPDATCILNCDGTWVPSGNCDNANVCMQMTCSTNPSMTKCITNATCCSSWTNNGCDATNFCMNQTCDTNGMKRCVSDPSCVSYSFQCMDAQPNADYTACNSDACFSKKDCALKVGNDGTNTCLGEISYSNDGCDFANCNMYRTINNQCGNLVIVNPPNGASQCSCSNKLVLNDDGGTQVRITNNGKYLTTDCSKLILSNDPKLIILSKNSGGMSIMPITSCNGKINNLRVQKDLTIGTNVAVWYYNGSTGLIVDDQVNPQYLIAVDSNGNVYSKQYQTGIDNTGNTLGVNSWKITPLGTTSTSIKENYENTNNYNSCDTISYDGNACFMNNYKSY